ncbi:hypothetical protein FOL47_010662 [Perkinsus chesapeaki]|uniref:C3H1-type domain-containing protein n=1 Tax=Perkinsus chesapeaki TaxID=330153 RepID=A0A7J6L3E5_PERCH|nr:hypothetical protein FOL47_010662 [Perkinsus chesapeaki]
MSQTTTTAAAVTEDHRASGKVPTGGGGGNRHHHNRVWRWSGPPTSAGTLRWVVKPSRSRGKGGGGGGGHRRFHGHPKGDGKDSGRVEADKTSTVAESLEGFEEEEQRKGSSAQSTASGYSTPVSEDLASSRTDEVERLGNGGAQQRSCVQCPPSHASPPSTCSGVRDGAQLETSAELLDNESAAGAIPQEMALSTSLRIAWGAMTCTCPECTQRVADQVLNAYTSGSIPTTDEAVRVGHEAVSEVGVRGGNAAASSGHLKASRVRLMERTCEVGLSAAPVPLLDPAKARHAPRDFQCRDDPIPSGNESAVHSGGLIVPVERRRVWDLGIWYRLYCAGTARRTGFGMIELGFSAQHSLHGCPSLSNRHPSPADAGLTNFNTKHPCRLRLCGNMSRACREEILYGRCKRGSACQFSHDRSYSKALLKMHKSSMCPWGRDCYFGTNCLYSHTRAEVEKAQEWLIGGQLDEYCREAYLAHQSRMTTELFIELQKKHQYRYQDPFYSAMTMLPSGDGSLTAPMASQFGPPRAASYSGLGGSYQ